MDKSMYLATRRMEDRLWWYAGMQRISERLLDRFVGQRQLDILDAGCGTGGALVWLSSRGRAVGVDLSDLAVAFARQRGLRHLARASISCLPFPAQRFDLVTCFDVLYHMWVDDQAALDEFARVLRPGGFALVRVAANNWLRGKHDGAGYTRHRYGRGELRAKLEQAGLRILAASYANSLLFPAAMIRRLAEGLMDGQGPDGDGRVHPLSSDFWLPPRPLNAALGRVLGAEAELVARSALPMGLSLVALAQKA